MVNADIDTTTTIWTCVRCGVRVPSTDAIGLGWGLVAGLREGSFNPYCDSCLEAWRRSCLPATTPTEGRNPGRLAR